MEEFADDHELSSHVQLERIESEEDEQMDIEEEHEVEEPSSTAIVLHEDKQYYASSAKVFGQDVEAVVHERDTQPLTEPIIGSVDRKKFTIEEEDVPLVNYSRSFQAELMGYPEQIRNVAFVGHLHHGKTSLLDMLVRETHNAQELMGRRQNEQMRYTDIGILEVERGITINSSPMSLLLQNRKGKSHLLNIIDTPGHSDFIDEVSVAGRIADGFVVVMDVVEGLMINTRRVIQYAINEKIPFVLCLNKMDRLMLDLKLPPADAYLKLLRIIEDVNNYILQISPLDPIRLSPELGNVIFAATAMEWCFTLPSFAYMYQQNSPKLDAEGFTKRLWGNVFYSPSTRKFTRNASGDSVRSFLHFILEPLYKLYTHTIGEDEESLKKTLSKLQIRLKPAAYKLEVRPLLKTVCKLFFGNSWPLVDTLLKHLPSPLEGARTKVELNYTGTQDSLIAKSMIKNDEDGPLVINVVKLYNNADGSEFYALGRVMSGTVRQGQLIRVLGEGYTLDDQEDMAVVDIKELWIPQTKYKVPINAIPPGNWALIGGIDGTIVKSATIVSDTLEEDAYIFQPLKYISRPVVKVSVEPLNPSELPKMLDGLRKVNKSYALLQTKVEESGEHIILGSGELYLDCVLHDLRKLYSQMEIKVSDPATKFSETCIETTAMKFFAQTPNGHNRLTIIAEPLEEEIANDIENGLIDAKWSNREMSRVFQERYHWDAMASRSIWAFGPDDMGPNILQNDTLPTEVDRRLLGSIRESVRQGFQWSTREGPLCEEPIRRTKFRLIDALIAQEPMYRGGGQIIPTTRRACYSSFLMASPRLLEPVYSFYVTCTSNSVSKIYNLVSRRRGNVESDLAIPGTPLYSVQGRVPVIDSFGLETDIRVATEGQAMVSLVFDNWELVPGDPLDSTQIVKPLQAAGMSQMARDFVLKTRRRKGLSEEPTVTKYLDQSLLDSLKDTELLRTLA